MELAEIRLSVIVTFFFIFLKSKPNFDHEHLTLETGQFSTPPKNFVEKQVFPFGDENFKNIFLKYFSDIFQNRVSKLFLDFY